VISDWLNAPMSRTDWLVVGLLLLALGLWLGRRP
jgi:hypothetical protein